MKFLMKPDMIHKRVLNASPLILLGRAELLKPIAPLADTWIVPGGVIQEVAVKGPLDSNVSDLSISSQVLRIDVPGINRFVAGWDLGRGESEVITVALSQSGTGAVLDDSQARKCAKVMDIPLIGSVGLIARARRKNLIPFAKPAIEKLISAGLYIDPEIIARVLRAIGEYPVN
jgi:predicted nucleic acid-binding protein